MKIGFDKAPIVAAALMVLLAAGCDRETHADEGDRVPFERAEQSAIGRVAIGCQMTDAAVADQLKQTQCASCLAEQARSAMSKCPSDRGVLLVGMYASLKAKDLGQAGAFYEALAAHGRANADEHAEAGYLYLQLGDEKRALNAFELAVDGGANAFAQFELAELLHEANRDDEAAELLKRIVKEHPKQPQTHDVIVIGEDAIVDDAEALLRKIQSPQ